MFEYLKRRASKLVAPLREMPPLSGPSAPLLAVRPDGTAVALPPIGVRGGDIGNAQRYRFLPDGSGLVYMEGVNLWQDFRGRNPSDPSRCHAA